MINQVTPCIDRSNALTIPTDVKLTIKSDGIQGTYNGFVVMRQLNSVDDERSVFCKGVDTDTTFCLDWSDIDQTLL